MGSAAKASWAVAASVAAVEALKDQVGLCRWNYAFRALHQHAKSSVVRSKAAGQVRKISGAVESQAARGSVEAMRKMREAEKAENVMHLVCWGPK